MSWFVALARGCHKEVPVHEFDVASGVFKGAALAKLVERLRDRVARPPHHLRDEVMSQRERPPAGGILGLSVLP